MALVVAAAAAGDALFATGAWLLGRNQRKMHETTALTAVEAMKLEADITHKKLDLWDRAQQREFDERERERDRQQVLELERIQFVDRERERLFEDRERQRRRDRERAGENLQLLQEERALGREEWDREERRAERLEIWRAQEALGPIAGLLFLLEKHKGLLFPLVTFIIFERIVTKLIDDNFGYRRL
ncbi:hypothetical protein FS837_007926, partial [Tulasnella sp. UAMH 9824]